MTSKKLYKNYFSHYGSLSGVGELKKHFSAWNYRYGKFLPENKHAKIVDAGCGNGELLFWLKSLGYKDLTGVDVSPGHIKLAKERRVGSIHTEDIINFLKNRRGCCDCIFAIDLIEHFGKDDLMRLLVAFYGALKPGGKLILKTPNAESPFGSRYRYLDFTHKISLTRHSLSHVLSEAGFRNAIVRPINPVVYGIKSAIRFLLWKVINLALKFYMAVETGSSQGIFTQNMMAVATKNLNKQHATVHHTNN